MADELGLSALALTDRNGLYGVVRFAQAAREVEMRTVEQRLDALDAVEPADQRRKHRGLVAAARADLEDVLPADVSRDRKSVV